MTPLKDQMRMKTVHDGGQWWLAAIVPIGLAVIILGTASLIVWVSHG